MKAPLKLVIFGPFTSMLLATAIYGQSELIELPSEVLDRYVGTYSRLDPQEATHLEGRGDATVTSDGTGLRVHIDGIRAYSAESQVFLPTSPTRFVRRIGTLEGELQFELDDDGTVARMILSPGGITQSVIFERID